MSVLFFNATRMIVLDIAAFVCVARTSVLSAVVAPFLFLLPCFSLASLLCELNRLFQWSPCCGVCVCISPYFVWCGVVCPSLGATRTDSGNIPVEPSHSTPNYNHNNMQYCVDRIDQSVIKSNLCYLQHKHHKDKQQAIYILYKKWI